MGYANSQGTTDQHHEHPSFTRTARETFITTPCGSNALLARLRPVLNADVQDAVGRNFNACLDIRLFPDEMLEFVPTLLPILFVTPPLLRLFVHFKNGPAGSNRSHAISANLVIQLSSD